jgi:hypothetical protein
MIITITTDTAMAAVAFRYDEDALDVIRQVPGRHWDSEERVWWIRAALVAMAAQDFTAAGFDVLVDGKPWTPPTTSSGSRNDTGSPWGALFRTLPEHLRQPTYKALSKVLHPDTGGDGRLMQELNDTWKDIKP